MKANPEFNQDTYPIAASFNGSTSKDGLLCDIIDMRTLTLLYAANKTQHELAFDLAKLNAEFRAGLYKADNLAGDVAAYFGAVQRDGVVEVAPVQAAQAVLPTISKIVKLEN